MRNSNAVESTAPLSTGSSVPISLYRELCDELQHKNAELEAADHQNQRLTAQNQQLRQELHQLVQRVMQTQQAVTQMTTDATSESTIAASPVASTVPLRPRRAMRSVNEQSTPIKAASRAIVDAPLHPNAEADPLTTRLWNQTSNFTQDLQGWKMAVMMGLIVLSAFGAGFLIMRPFMAQQHQAQPLQPQTPKR